MSEQIVPWLGKTEVIADFWRQSFAMWWLEGKMRGSEDGKLRQLF